MTYFNHTINENTKYIFSLENIFNIFAVRQVLPNSLELDETQLLNIQLKELLNINFFFHSYIVRVKNYQHSLNK